MKPVPTTTATATTVPRLQRSQSQVSTHCQTSVLHYPCRETFFFSHFTFLCLSHYTRIPSGLTFHRKEKFIRGPKSFGSIKRFLAPTVWTLLAKNFPNFLFLGLEVDSQKGSHWHHEDFFFKVWVLKPVSLKFCSWRHLISFRCHVDWCPTYVTVQSIKRLKLANVRRQSRDRWSLIRTVIPSILRPWLGHTLRGDYWPTPRHDIVLVGQLCLPKFHISNWYNLKAISVDLK